MRGVMKANKKQIERYRAEGDLIKSVKFMLDDHELNIQTSIIDSKIN